jgi:hypothetical protein
MTEACPEQCATCYGFFDWINANSECAKCSSRECERKQCAICTKVFGEDFITARAEWKARFDPTHIPTTT